MKNNIDKNKSLFLNNHHIIKETDRCISMLFDNTNKIKKLMTVDEVAEVLAVRPKTVRAWVYQGKIPCVKVGKRAVRFSVVAVNRWLERQ